MSSAFTIFPTKHKASKPTRFKAEKIAERRDKPQFLRVHFSKTKGDLEATGFLTGTLTSVVDNILKHKRASNLVDDQMYYNVSLMLAGTKKDIEKFINDNVPIDTYLQQDLRNAYLYLGPMANFNERWLKKDYSSMLTYEESLQEFSELKASQGGDYENNVQYYYNQFVGYFSEAQGKYEATKIEKEKNVMSFEALADSLGPFKYAETGLACLKHLKSNMGEVKKKEGKRGTDSTFDKYFASEPGAVVRVMLSNNNKTGVTTLKANKEVESNIVGSTRSKAFKPFPTMFPHLYFNNENIYDPFIRELRSNVAKLANTLAKPEFSSWTDVHILPTDTDDVKMAKIDKFLDYLEADYSAVRQSKLSALSNRQYNPMMNNPVSTTFRV